MSIFESKFQHPYPYHAPYEKRVAYFCMEFGIDQSLKIYSGGLGYLAGSHMRSAFSLHQNLIGIGILWKKGYYDQVRKQDQSMDVLFMEKNYFFLEDTGIKFQIEVNSSPVWVTAKYLAPHYFNTIPIFLLTTDLPENDYLAQSISHVLYDADTAAKIAQFMLLGIGGARLLEELGYNADIIHLNEAHGISCVFHMYKKLQSVDEVRERLVFTTHTPEEAGNEKHDIHLLHKMGFFNGFSVEEVQALTGMEGDLFDHSLCALRFAKRANAVSKLHGEVAQEMWSKYENICPIISITNSQNAMYWADGTLYEYLHKHRLKLLLHRKKYLKSKLFESVADQTGKIFDPNILTIVWARRFAGYKRADLILQNEEQFHRLMNRTDMPVQIIFAGKPYPADYAGISTFNKLVHVSKKYKNMAVLVGYELKLSRKLKGGADVWLNTPRVPREASGTSGMTAAMNGAINFTCNDGWIREFANDKNSFLIPIADQQLPLALQDLQDLNNLYTILEQRILPMFYQRPGTWFRIMQTSMNNVLPYFDSDRMADEYYRLMYNE